MVIPTIIYTPSPVRRNLFFLPKIPLNCLEFLLHYQKLTYMLSQLMLCSVYLLQDRLHNLQDLVQNENAGSLVQKLLRISDNDSRALNQEQGLSQGGDLTTAQVTCPYPSPCPFVLNCKSIPSPENTVSHVSLQYDGYSFSHTLGLKVGCCFICSPSHCSLQTITLLLCKNPFAILLHCTSTLIKAVTLQLHHNCHLATYSLLLLLY